VTTFPNERRYKKFLSKLVRIRHDALDLDLWETIQKLEEAEHWARLRMANLRRKAENDAHADGHA